MQCVDYEGHWFEELKIMRQEGKCAQSRYLIVLKNEYWYIFWYNITVVFYNYYYCYFKRRLLEEYLLKNKEDRGERNGQEYIYGTGLAMADNCGKLVVGNWGFIILDSLLLQIFKGFPQWKLFQKPDLSGPVSSNTGWTLLASWIKPLLAPPSNPHMAYRACIPFSPFSPPLQHACLSHHMHTRQASQTEYLVGQLDTYPRILYSISL